MVGSRLRSESNEFSTGSSFKTTNIKVVSQTKLYKAVSVGPNQRRWIHLGIVSGFMIKHVLLAPISVALYELTVSIDFSTVIWFLVQSTCLSDAMISVEPSVSTAGNLRTIQLPFVGLLFQERTMVTMAGSQPGILLTQDNAIKPSMDVPGQDATK